MSIIGKSGLIKRKAEERIEHNCIFKKNEFN